MLKRQVLVLAACSALGLAVAGCNGNVEDSESYQQGYDIGSNLPRGGAEGERLCEDTVNMAALNPVEGEDLDAALQGCKDAVNDR